MMLGPRPPGVNLPGADRSSPIAFEVCALAGRPTVHLPVRLIDELRFIFSSLSYPRAPIRSCGRAIRRHLDHPSSARRMPSRRDFLKTSAAVGGSVLVGAAAPGLLAAAAPERARAPMRILILGGTGFIGPHLVKHAVARGHKVSIFTRGRRDDSMLPDEVERLVGDRNGQLGALEGKKWDAVFDDSATNPDWVRQSAALLKGNVSQYLFTSSTGVYYPYLKKGLDESTPPLLEGDMKDGSAAFGINKAQCEKIVLDTFGEGGIVVRPSYIVGPGDTTDRFPYWPVRLARGGEVLVPGKRDDPAQFIDVRDLVEFMVKVVEDKRSGPFNVAGPRDAITIRAFVEAAARALDAEGHVHAGRRLRLPHRAQDRRHGAVGDADGERLRPHGDQQRAREGRGARLPSDGHDGARHACLVADRAGGAPQRAALRAHG